MYDEDDEQEKRNKLIRRQRIDDVRAQMGTPYGRRFVWSLLVTTRFESRSSMFDTHGGRQSYLLGAYEVGRSMAEEVRDLCPQDYLLMLRENNPQPEEVPQ